MKITYEQKLIDYMKRKGYSTIAVDRVDAIGCCADMSELNIYFPGEKTIQKIKESGCRILEGEMGEILVCRGLDVDDEVELGLKSFFGAKDVTVKGIRAFTL